MIYFQGMILGLLSTAALSIIMQLGIGFHFTRMNIPFLLGTLLTLNRSKAVVLGFVFHFLIGLFFGFVYLLIIGTFGWMSLWFCLFLGLFHGLFLLTIGCLLLPKLHPRMTDENHGPQAAKLLEPPGFLGMNYGFLTPFVVLVAHAVFATVIGLAFFLCS